MIFLNYLVYFATDRRNWGRCMHKTQRTFKFELLERNPHNTVYLKLSRRIMALFLIPAIILSLIILLILDNTKLKNKQAVESQVILLGDIIIERIDTLFDKFHRISCKKDVGLSLDLLSNNNPEGIKKILSLLDEQGIDESYLCSVILYNTSSKKGTQVYKKEMQLSINKYFAIPTKHSYSNDTLFQSDLRFGVVERFNKGGTYYRVFSFAFSPFSDRNELIVCDFDIDLVNDLIQYRGLEYTLFNGDTNDIIAFSASLPKNISLNLKDKEIRYTINGDMITSHYGKFMWRINLVATKEFYEKLGEKIKVDFKIILIYLVSIPCMYLLVWLGLKYRLKPLRNISDTLEKSYENPITELAVLQDKIIATKIEQKEAQIISLQNQINPHFLYNTLDTIRGVAIINNVPMIAEMSKRLSLLFRYSMQNEIEVSIKSELNNIQDYLTIQNFRHDNRFMLIINAPVEVGTYKILRLTLQPLIENCIKHGLENKVTKGLIKVDIRIMDKILKIVVTDNGTGIRSDKLEYYNELFQRPVSQTYYSKESKSVGLINVNTRIKLYYGYKFGVRFIEKEIGACIELTIPTIASDE